MNDKKNIEFTTDDMYKDPNEQKDEILEERLRRRIKIRDEDQEIYDTTDDSVKRNQTHEDVKNSNNEIARIEKILEERKRENPIYYQLKGLSDDILEERLLKAEELHEENKNILEAGVQDPETRREIHGEYISAGMEASAIERILKEREGSKKR